jgi:hypothetical protein
MQKKLPKNKNKILCTYRLIKHNIINIHTKSGNNLT